MSPSSGPTKRCPQPFNVSTLRLVAGLLHISGFIAGAKYLVPSEVVRPYVGGGVGFINLKRIITASLTMDKLVQDVLAYSRVVHSELTVEKVDLQRLISQIIQTDSTLQEAKASIVVQGPLMSVQGNESYLTQCLANLLANAVKFVPPGVKPQVKIWTERKNTWTRLWVQDNGIGIAPHQQEQIFCMFERLHSKKEYEGTGIGLALVKKAVTRMGGKVGVISSPGTGSRFWIQLRSTEDV
jgi:signal transduction histidine kinase